MFNVGEENYLKAAGTLLPSEFYRHPASIELSFALLSPSRPVSHSDHKVSVKRPLQCPSSAVSTKLPDLKNNWIYYTRTQSQDPFIIVGNVSLLPPRWHSPQHNVSNFDKEPMTLSFKVFKHTNPLLSLHVSRVSPVSIEIRTPPTSGFWFILTLPGPRSAPLVWWSTDQGRHNPHSQHRS